MAVFPAVLCLFMAAIVTGQNVDISPKKAVRKLGDSVIVMCKVPYKIDSCRFNVGGQSYRLSPTALNGDVIYSGQGLEVGECGAELKNVREEWNGKISCILPPQSGAGIEITGDMQLIVARQPGEPTLITPPQSAFREDDKFFAQCKVPHGRPAARISWFLDSEPLLSSLSQPAVTSEPGSDLETISQNATLVLRADDDGKMLECKTEHEALEQPLSSKRQLVVHYKPKRLETGTLTIFGLKLGSEGRLNVTVRSNPAPQAVWQVGDMQVTPGQPGNQGLVALKPVLLNNGFYNVTLVLEQIAKEDVDRTYYLTVGNALGSEQIPVRISTLDEPAGMELGAGSIAGIVIAVLILLIAIFLAVFAFATDRWCFAERRRDGNKSSGESTAAGDVLLESGNTLPRNSDTESAVGGRERSRLANLGARVMAALPRSKDKVQASEAQPTEAEEKALSEEKKGVVYAELVLGDTSSEKPPPPSTEYAEIVYTEQPKEEHKETPQ